MTINLKSNKGFTTADIGVAMIIMVLFATIMTSMFYSVFMSTTEAKRTATALNYAVDIFENIGRKRFADVIPGIELFNLDSLSDAKIGTAENNDGIGTLTATIGTYNITLKIENYKDTKKIKIITLKIDYPISRKKSESMELQRLKVIEEI